MAFVSFKLDQLFIVLAPELVDILVGAVRFPNEPDFVQTFLSIKSKLVILMMVPLRANPVP
jgi:hypothetical protein